VGLNALTKSEQLIIDHLKKRILLVFFGMLMNIIITIKTMKQGSF
jgi:hypothetical protein